MITRISLDDVGTRGEHITHMRDNWQTAADSLEQRFNWLHEPEKKLLLDLRTVISFIDEHLTNDFLDIERITH